MASQPGRQGWQGRLAAFFTPPLLLLGLVYHALASLQINAADSATSDVVAVVVAVGGVLGLLAAVGGALTRAAVFALLGVLWLDVTTEVSSLFEGLTPVVRHARARDRQRIDDIAAIQGALETHIRTLGPLPSPESYGEGTGPVTFWGGWWDVSSEDGDGDGVPFLDFLVERGLMAKVPVDPENTAPRDGHPTRGQQYAFMHVPPGYVYAGGLCEAQAGKAAYVLAVTNLESKQDRSPQRDESDSCACLWREQPSFFTHQFDHVVCGYYAP